MKQFLKDFFTYSKKERNGIIVLAILLVLLIGANYLLNFLVQRPATDLSAFRKDIQAFERAVRKANQSDSDRNEHRKSKRARLELFAFDPNHLSREKWKKLGVSDPVISTIKNYEKAGGSFEIKSDLKEIYGLADTQYQRLKPYIQLPKKKGNIQGQDSVTYEKQNGSHAQGGTNKLYENVQVPLNQADSAQLDQVYGIGPFFASTIVEYRENLGGFYNKRQLLEVYGLDSADYQRMKDELVIQDTSIQKLNINKASVKDLGKHPYISWRLARVLHNFADQHGPIRSTKRIKELHILNDSLYQVITPYITAKYDSTKN